MQKPQDLKPEADKPGRPTRSSLYIQNSRDFLVFLVLLVGVFFYWYMSNMGEVHESEYTFEPVLEHVPDDVIITEPFTEALTVTFKDKGEKILEYRARKTLRRLTIDYRQATPVNGHYMLTGQALRKMLMEQFSGSVEILSYTPDTLQYFAAPAKGRRLPVRVNGIIATDNEHVINGIRFTPDSVTVHAPRAVLDTMRAVFTSRVSLVQLTDSVSQMIVLSLPVRGTLCVPSEVRLDVTVSPYVEKTLELPIKPYMCPFGQTLKMFPSRANVSFLVSLHDFYTIKAEDFELVVNYNNLDKEHSGKAWPELLRQPSGIRAVTINPQEVEYLMESTMMGGFHERKSH